MKGDVGDNNAVVPAPALTEKKVFKPLEKETSLHAKPKGTQKKKTGK